MWVLCFWLAAGPGLGEALASPGPAPGGPGAGPDAAGWSGPPVPVLAAVGAHAWLLYDPVSRQVLAERRGLARLAPASTTKILTCLVVLENSQPQDEVIIGANAARTGGARLGLAPGQRFRVEELLYGLMLLSANDAAVALAEHVGGSVPGFARLMNARARELGALASSFVNPHGLAAPGHYSTAYDLAVIAAAAVRRPDFRALVSSREHRIGSLDPSWTALLRNTNQLLWSYEGADGIKTGTTRQAGQCLVASATREGRQLVSVVLRSPNRWGDSARLLTFGFERTLLHWAGRRGDPGPPALALDPLPPAWWPWGRPLWVPVPVQLGEDLAWAGPVGREGQLLVEYALDPGLALPLAAGQRVGEAAAHLDGRRVAVVPLVVGSAMPQGVAHVAIVRALSGAVRALLRRGLY